MPVKYSKVSKSTLIIATGIGITNERHLINTDALTLVCYISCICLHGGK